MSALRGRVNSTGSFLPREHAHVLLEPVRHWTAGRKERLLAAVVDSLITEEQACAAHNLSHEELDEWARGFIASRTIEGLKASRRLPKL